MLGTDRRLEQFYDGGENASHGQQCPDIRFDEVGFEHCEVSAQFLLGNEVCPIRAHDSTRRGHGLLVFDARLS